MLIEALTEAETRVLGTLLEKSLATPDYYPMTLNALRNACNQKSSRDPVTEYGEETLSLALSGLKRKCLVTFIPYGSQGNSYKYRHFLEDVRFNLRKPDLAVLAVLFLRGSQTVNEIRLRASSLHTIESLEDAEALLKGLADRNEPLAELLPKRAGWKEPRWRDKPGTHEDSSEPLAFDESEGLAMEGRLPEDTARSRSAKRDEFEEMKAKIAALKTEVSDLKSQVVALQETVETIRSELGG